VQLTADQQVNLSITGQDKYGNPVDITGRINWASSDTSIVTVTSDGTASAVAVAVGPVGTASVTVTNDYNSDDEIDFQGSVAIDVVGGDIAEIVVQEGAITDKGAAPDNTLPTPPTNSGNRPDNTLPTPPTDSGAHPDNTLPDSGAHPDNTLPT
jgi:hypothetical protein